MGWREKLQPASFKGVPFLVMNDSQPAGQRVQVHEYPQRDLPLIEPLGKKTNEIRMAAFVAGDDCLDQRDALLAVIWEAGSGELIHPWMGSITVSVIECTYSHSRNAMGMVQFDLVFVEGEAEPDYPTASKSAVAELNNAADGLLGSGADRFLQALDSIDLSRISVAGVVGNSIGKMLSTVQSVYGSAGGLFDGVESFVSQILASPTDFVNDLFSTIGNIRSDFAGFYSKVDGGSSVFGVNNKLSAISELSKVSVSGSQNSTSFVNSVKGVMQDAVAANLLRDVAAMPVIPVQNNDSGLVTVDVIQDSIYSDIGTADTLVGNMLGVSENRPPVADDLLALNDSISDSFWDIAVNAQPDHYNKIATAKSTANKHLVRVAKQGISLTDVDNPLPIPALALAYGLYGDASFTSDIVARNDIEHPGFVPAASLQVPRG